jgi:hypothetical protein
MTDTVTVALISSGATVLVSITALLLNYRGFVSLERRIERVEQDMKEFFKLLSVVSADVARLKDHVGLK